MHQGMLIGLLIVHELQLPVLPVEHEGISQNSEHDEMVSMLPNSMKLAEISVLVILLHEQNSRSLDK